MMLKEQNSRQTPLSRAAMGNLIPASQITQFVKYEYLAGLLDIMDQLILSYLDLHTILNFSQVSKNLWHPEHIIHPSVLKELQHRNRHRCVTVYTRKEGASSVGINSDLDLGHSALRTWSGGENGTGIYVSFYPGHTRKKGSVDQKCKQSVAHFHTLKQESIDGIEKIDLYGLDVEAINQAFKLLHDENMTSRKPWSTRFNCSDLVLELLETGGIHKKISLRRYDEASIIILGILFSQMSLEFVRLHPFLLEKWNYIF